jgi:hypothetical protein
LTDIIQVADEYYVRATSALADDRTRVLKYGDTFAVFNRYGNIEAFGPSQFGLVPRRKPSPFSLHVATQSAATLTPELDDPAKTTLFWPLT